MKVLLIRLSSLGDVVLATSAVEALAGNLPEAEIMVLTKSRFVGVFANNPHVSGVLELGEGEGIFSLASRVRGEKFDWVVDLHNNLRTTLLKFLVRGPKWSVYDKARLSRRMSVYTGKQGSEKPLHVVDRYLKALKVLAPPGVTDQRVLPSLYPGPDDVTAVDALLSKGGVSADRPLVALAPGARWETKKWPEENWMALAARIEEELGATPVVIGSKDEAEVCARVAAGAKNSVNLCGQTTILQSAEVISRSVAIITNDSAPLHFGVAVATPVVALMGPTVEGFGFYPLGDRDIVLQRDMDCRPCSLHGGDKCPEGHHRCLVEITVDEVMSALAGLLV